MLRLSFFFLMSECYDYRSNLDDPLTDPTNHVGAMRSLKAMS